jgi:RNA polymerase sigma-70 factor, ECF subfamily
MLDQKKRFENTFLQYEGALKSLALRLTKDIQEAEDLVQNTYLKAYRFFHLYKEGTNPKAWIMTIMFNTFRSDYVKSRKRHEAGAIYGEEINWFLHKEASSSSSTMKTLVPDEILNAFTELPEVFTKPVILAYVKEETYEDIATQLGIPLGTTKSRINRGRKMIRKYLEERNYLKTCGKEII